MDELYIYYRSRLAHAEHVRQAVLDWQRELGRRHPALRCRLLRRPAPHGDTLTWMETYRTGDALHAISAGTALHAELAGGAPALSPWTDGQRHVEVFVACAS